MYSPKVPEQLIPRLYQLAKNRRIPMTRLVAQLIQLGLTHLERETSHDPAPTHENPPVPHQQERKEQ